MPPVGELAEDPVAPDRRPDRRRLTRKSRAPPS